MNQRVIGLVGEIASGKDTAANHLVKCHGAEIASFSKPLRDILDILGLPQTRENMIWLGVDLRERFGQNILAKAMAKIVEKSEAPIVCLPNVRLLSDIELLEHLPNFYLIQIVAAPQIRFKRLKNRNQNVDDQTKTWEQFLADAQLPTEVPIKETAKKALFCVDNNGDLDNLFRRISQIVRVTEHGDTIYA